MERYHCPKCGFTGISEEEIWECPNCFSPVQRHKIENEVEKLKRVAADCFSYEKFDVQENYYVFKVENLVCDFDYLRERFDEIGFYPFLKRKNGNVFLFAVKKQEIGGENILWNILFFVATLATTTYAGYYLSISLVQKNLMENPWIGAFSYSIGLMFILLCHELGHKFTAIKKNVKSSWPYFIPFPFFLGTFGAIIKSKSPVPNRSAMIYLGASGPIAGFLMALPITFIGLKMSYVVPHEALEKGVMILGDSIAFRLIGFFAVDVPQGYDLYLHPLAFAGWVTMFVTAMNLIPVGQLDGGHVIRGLFGEKNHKRISLIFVAVLFGLGVFTWPGWIVWAFFIYFFTLREGPGPMNEIEELSATSKIVGVTALIIFFLTFILTPFSMIP